MSVAFDGRASRMSELLFYETSTGYNVGPTTATFGKTYYKSQKPAIWDGLDFTKNNISLVPDARYGKAYKAHAAIGDQSAWQKPGWFLSARKAGAQVADVRPNNLGKWDYFALATRVPSFMGDPTKLAWLDAASLGYQTSRGDQFAWRLVADAASPTKLSWAIEANVGYASDPKVFHADHRYVAKVMPLVFGRWDEWVFAIRWATDNSGAVRVFHRVPGGKWSMPFEKLNWPTYLWGKTSYNPDPGFAKDGSNWPSVLDKLGLYYGNYDAGVSETVYESGLVRCSDLATAQATFPA